MNAMVKETQTDKGFDELKIRLKTTWMTGDYDLFSRYMQKDAERFFQRLGVTPGTRLLDVGCGAGQLALIAARAGAQVTGCDISTNWLEKARARAAAEGLDVTFDEGDAESLPYEDGQFDVVTSLSRSDVRASSGSSGGRTHPGVPARRYDSHGQLDTCRVHWANVQDDFQAYRSLRNACAGAVGR